MQITIVNGSVEFDGEPILSKIDFTLHDNEKIALVGRNGCGKTTLLKVLAGEIQLVKGVGDEDLGFFFAGKPDIGYLRQTACRDESVTLLQEVSSAYQSVIDLEEKMNEAQKLMESSSTEETVKKYTNLREAFENAGGYTYVKEYLTAIRKFGFSDAEMQKPLSEFSGGQLTKIALLKLLLSRPDVLLLDEPTNHLDVEAVEWLEKFLKEYKNSCVIVSHDRMFLDRIVNVVYEIEYGETTRYKGNYTAFTIQKKSENERALKEASIKRKEIERLQKIVDKFRYKASKAAMAQAKLSAIKRIGTVEDPARFDERTFHSNFDSNEQTTAKTLILDRLQFGYDKPFGTLSATIFKGDKVGIIGANGCGKSTLIHTLMNLTPALLGTFTFGAKTQIGYFDQMLTQDATEKTVLESFSDEFPTMTSTDARTALGSFMFTGGDVFKRVCDLSGGEKVRLALCRILRHKPNVLILDEPTNHMDIVGKENFERSLKNYSGTVIVVSHDRYFINKICNRLIVFENGGTTLYDCNFEQYENLIAASEKTDFPQKKEAEKPKKSGYVSENKLRDRRAHRISVLEGKITEIEAKISEYSEEYERPEVACDYKRILEIDEEIKELENKIAPLIEEWEELSAL